MRTFTGQLLQDLRYALRMMAANPAFTALAVLSLALGIGANTAIYSFMDAILMRALPVQQPESLVVVRWHANGSVFRDPNIGINSGNFPYPAYEALRASNPVFTTMFAFAGAGRLNLQIQGMAGLAEGQYVSGDFFRGLGVPPAAGRLIDDSDDRLGAPAVAVVSFMYARRRFGEAEKALGQLVRINDTPFTITGVAAREFFGINPAGAAELYLPLHTNALLEANAGSRYLDGNYYWVEMMGRLRAGVAIGQAQAALAPIFDRFVANTATMDKERVDLPALLLQEGAGNKSLTLDVGQGRQAASGRQHQKTDARGRGQRDRKR